MNAPHERHIEPVQHSGNRFIGFNHEHLDHGVWIAIIGRASIDNTALIIIDQFRFRQVQMEHAVFLPAFLDRSRQLFHVLQ